LSWIVVCLLLAVACAGRAVAGDMTGLAWKQSNIVALRALNKSAVAELVNDIRDTRGPVPRPTAEEIGEFR
jgi:hypothetical protein